MWGDTCAHVSISSFNNTCACICVLINISSADFINMYVLINGNSAQYMYMYDRTSDYSTVSLQNKKQQCCIRTCIVCYMYIVVRKSPSR